MLSGAKLTGIGVLTFLGADQFIHDSEYGGLILQYLIIRGNEDKNLNGPANEY